MATSSDDMNHKLTFRRFEDGEHTWDDMVEKIFDADHSHKCPTYVHQTPPCQGSCPAGEDIRGWLQIVRGIEQPIGEISMSEYAFRRSTDANPFPSVMGRVCPAPCEDGCNRNEVEDHVGINAVEQWIGDTARAEGYKFDPPAADTGKKIAIVGSGPAGLAAAYQLRRIGHACTVFDEREELGGMMRYGIPGYRTPRDMLDDEIGRIVEMGVDIKTNTRVGKDVSVEQLEKDYDAILWAVGTHAGKHIPVEGADAPNCLTGVDFLRAFNDGRLKLASEKVVVIGGGDTSIDVASVARRLGHIADSHDKDRPEAIVMGYTAHDVSSSASREGATVTLTSLFPVENMTAAEHEVNDALREGVDIKGSVMPLKVIQKDGRAVAMEYAECKFEDNRPVAIEGTEFTLECDLVVSAIGQKGELDDLGDLDNGYGFIDCDQHYQVKDKPGHFVAGDIVRPHLLTTAIGQASVAVQSIDHYLKNEELRKRPKVDVHHFSLLQKLNDAHLAPESYDKEASGDLRGTSEQNYAVHNYEDRSSSVVIPHEDLFLGHFEYTDRVRRDEIHINGDEVLGNFTERLIGYTEEQAAEEANRCMSCGMCFECDNCVIYCPQDAVYRVKKDQSTTGRYVATDYDKCVGCHICAEVCPTGYIQMGMGE